MGQQKGIFFFLSGGHIISTLKLFTELYRLLSLPAFHLQQFKTPVIHSHDSPALLSSIRVNGVVSEGFVRPSADERLYLFIISRCICSSLVDETSTESGEGEGGGGGEKSDKQVSPYIFTYQQLINVRYHTKKLKTNEHEIK